VVTDCIGLSISIAAAENTEKRFDNKVTTSLWKSPFAARDVDSSKNFKNVFPLAGANVVISIIADFLTKNTD
jgi:hypothetical protein